MYRQTFEDLCKHPQTLEKLHTLQNLLVDSREAKVGDVVICGGFYSYVLEIKHWHPDTPNRPKAPIHDHWVAVETITTNGTRWHGYSLSDH